MVMDDFIEPHYIASNFCRQAKKQILERIQVVASQGKFTITVL
jgi:hypothetical protein